MRPLESQSGVLVHSSADRRLAVQHWLLSTLRDPRTGIREWRATGVAMLPLGTLFSAIRLPGRLVLTLIGAHSMPSGEIDAALAEMLGGAPVICDPRYQRYYVLMPASTPATWHMAADEWAEVEVDVMGRGRLLGVPKLSRTEPLPLDSYWSVPMESAAVLGAPLTAARFIAAARHLMEPEQL
ncbi:hypothetical protein [Streptomyces sp. Amel2xC10]|uniref:hypothetical protein n=1 Tax=Streptomyces sp. Amel2xC10 TaxID=1305826 RepID=UPI00211A86B8|nr:hypothetical protein [Streptomyces sp. Amel2xC10]